MITDDMLIDERPHLGGVHRVYRLPNGYGLSLINSQMVHAYQFAWEAAVRTPNGHLTYETPLTEDVEVFFNEEDANEFIARARARAWAEQALEPTATQSDKKPG